MCVGGRVKGGEGWREQGVCDNGGWVEISPFGVTTLSGETGGMRG